MFSHNTIHLRTIPTYKCTFSVLCCVCFVVVLIEFFFVCGANPRPWPKSYIFRIRLPEPDIFCVLNFRYQHKIGSQSRDIDSAHSQLLLSWSYNIYINTCPSLLILFHVTIIYTCICSHIWQLY